MPDTTTSKTQTSNTLEALTDNIIEAIQDVKGSKISKLIMDKIESAPASRFIICQGKSNTQVGAIADSIEERLRKEFRTKPYNIDGLRNSQWIVMDYGPVMVHVFMPEFRNLYNLEELWSDAETIEIPDLD